MGYALSRQSLNSTFLVPTPKLTEKNVADQTGQSSNCASQPLVSNQSAGRVHLVTGGYGGCGFELAKILYQHNATVYVAGRSKEKGDKAKYTIKEVMQEAHKSGLVRKVAQGKAEKADKEKLVEYYTSLPQNKPPKGDAKEWKDQTEAMLAAANMDPEANPRPERMDLARRPNRHLSFGTGIHFCLGHQLARIEGKCALEALFKRWPQLALAVPPESIRWRQRPGLRAIEKLPVAIQP